MGKQTAVAMTDGDELLFLQFLRSLCEIRLLQSSAPTKEGIWLEHFLPREEGHRQFYIWNTHFPWQPEYGQVTKDRSGKGQGWYFIANSSQAPLIEYNRHNFQDRFGHGYGRVYWSKYFAAPNGLSYDVDAFDKWYMQVVRWIRKNGRQKSKGTLNPYYLPDAWEKYGIAP